MTVTGYHISNQRFRKFDFHRMAMGVGWFAKDRKALLGHGHGAGVTNRKPVYLYECALDLKKVGGWAEYNKYAIYELKREGYDAVLLDGDYMVLESKNVKIKKVERVDVTVASSKVDEKKVAERVAKVAKVAKELVGFSFDIDRRITLKKTGGYMVTRGDFQMENESYHIYKDNDKIGKLEYDRFYLTCEVNIQGKRTRLMPHRSRTEDGPEVSLKLFLNSPQGQRWASGITIRGKELLDFS